MSFKTSILFPFLGLIALVAFVVFWHQEHTVYAPKFSQSAFANIPVAASTDAVVRSIGFPFRVIVFSAEPKEHPYRGVSAFYDLDASGIANLSANPYYVVDLEYSEPRWSECLYSACEVRMRSGKVSHVSRAPMGGD